MQSNRENYEAVRPFSCSVKYMELTHLPAGGPDSHIHEECEIYINLSGDVAFVVENSIYPIKPGDIIITRPFEYHHCVYYSDKLHKHFWILFSSQGNEFLLDAFFNRKAGEGNHLSLSPQDTDTLISLCHTMTRPEPRPGRRYRNFFQLIELLQSADVVQNSDSTYPPDVVGAINYINRHFAEAISVADMARAVSVSINTLERHFQKNLNTSPLAYLRKKRLANAAKLLSRGRSVAEASEESGFANYSSFISLFRKNYGITPHQYKKRYLQERENTG